MPINFAALDFLSPGLLEIELSDSRQVLYDQKYSLKVPTGPGQHREFWVALETPLQILDVGIYQTVEITVCFFRPSTGSKPMQVTTRRRVYTPAHYLLWCDFYPFSDQRQGLGLLTRANRLDMGYVRRIIVRLQCNTNMPDFWTEAPYTDFPLLEIGHRAPMSVIAAMSEATGTTEIPTCKYFDTSDIEILMKELDTTSDTFLIPKGYTDYERRGVQFNVTYSRKRIMRPSLQHALSRFKGYVRIIELRHEACGVLTVDYIIRKSLATQYMIREAGGRLRRIFILQQKANIELFAKLE